MYISYHLQLFSAEKQGPQLTLQKEVKGTFWEHLQSF
jgi:hypothetical protein